MSLLIDGHNLIGSGVFEDISLQDEDDEDRLVSRLRVWRSSYHGEVTVIFDHGITGGTSQALSGGGVKVIFARNPQEADDLIRRRIQQRRQGLTVVTNDWTLRQEAKRHEVDIWRADEFVRRMRTPNAPSDSVPVEKGAEAHVHLSDQEISEWIDLFGPSPKNNKHRNIQDRP